jgi:hypothetical protein
MYGVDVDGDETSVACHRFPPTVESQLPPSPLVAGPIRPGLWPIVSRDDFCGEFKKKTVK